MRIAQVAPLYECVPPKLYGGTERVVAYLTDELVRQGHDVTLFASGDSVTQARHVPVGGQAARLDPGCMDPLSRHVLLLEKVFAQAGEFDLIHFHIDYLHFPLSRRHAVTHLTTLHGRLDMPDLVAIYEEYPEMPVVSISNAQRAPFPNLNWLDTVYHGLPLDLYTCNTRPDGYLAFLGRLSPEKRPDRAIRIAERAGVKLMIAAKVDKADQEYFDDLIRPLLDNPWVEFIGEIGEAEKNEFLGNARALLFPIDWPEPFGLVMTEAMACGTPTVAYRRGSVPEIIDDGLTGFIVDSEDAAVEAVDEAARLNRAMCRKTFEQRFSSKQMASAYSRVYHAMLGGMSGIEMGKISSDKIEKDERAA